MKKAACVLLLAALLTAFLPQVDAAKVQDALPALFDSYEAGNGEFTLKQDARFFIAGEEIPAETVLETVSLVSREFAAKGLPGAKPLAVLWGPESNTKAGDVRLISLPTLPREGFSAEITTQGIVLKYADENGLLYGLRSILKYFLVNEGSTVDTCVFADAPDTPERTLMLDCARKYWSVEWVKNLLREMSWQGYNAIELHLTEEQGIRANIWLDAGGNTVADENGNDFSWLPGYKATNWASNGTSGSNGVSIEDPNGNRYYNRDELIELLKCAALYHIEVIPSVDVPGHSEYLIDRWTSSGACEMFVFSYQGSSRTDRPTTLALPGSNLYSDASEYPQYGTVDITKPYARDLTLALIQGYAAFFRSYGNCKSFNLGCDEIRGELSGDCFTAYVNEAAQMLRDMGYRVRAFNDYLYNSDTVALDGELELCVWTDSENADVAAYLADGRRLYNCIENYCYYVLRNNGTQGDARDGDCGQWAFHHATAQRIYSGCGGSCGFYDCQHDGGWNPSHFYTYNDASETTVTGEQLGGGYFLVWGDWPGWCEETHVWNGIDAAGTYNLLDRVRASAVKMWCQDADARVDYSVFYDYAKAVGTYPGFADCKSEARLPDAASPRPTPGAKTKVRIVCKTLLGVKEHCITAFSVDAVVGAPFSAQLPAFPGYRLLDVTNARLRGSGTIEGSCGADTEVTVCYENTPLLCTLEALLTQMPQEQGSYPQGKWSTYESVLLEVQRFIRQADSMNTFQEEVDAKIAALLIAAGNLTR